MVIEMKWVPVLTVAHLLGVTRQRVYELIKRGKLRAVHMDKHVYVDISSVRDRLDEVSRKRNRFDREEVVV